MSTIKDFIEYLKTLPPNGVVRVAIQDDAPAWQAYGPISFEPLDLSSKKGLLEYENDGEFELDIGEAN